MKKLFATLALTSSIFASDGLLEKMLRNSDQELIKKLAQMPRSEEVIEAVGRYWESLKAAPARAAETATKAAESAPGATSPAAVARAATASAEDFTMEVMDGKNVKTTWDHLLNAKFDSQKAYLAMAEIIRLARFPSVLASDLTKAKRALVAARNSTQADFCDVGKIPEGHAERFILALKKIGVEASLNGIPFEESQEYKKGYVEITIKLENMPDFSIQGETKKARLIEGDTR